MKILVLGSEGWIGGKMVKALNAKGTIEKINSEKEAVELLEKESPGVLVNCAGKTGKPNIDWCETHKRETLEANSLMPLWLALACEKKSVKLVQIGSGCIYQGNNNGKGFSEEDEPNFFGSFYSRSKILMQELLEDFKNALQLRIRMPVDSEPNSRNLITKLSKYDKIINEKNSVTVIEDFLKASKELIERKESGIFNIVNKPATSHKEIIELYKEIVNSKFECKFISLEELHEITKAERSNCVLSTEKLENAGLKMRETRKALVDCLQKYKQSLK